VVEDVEINREIISAVLSDIEGLVLEFACDGREAADKAEAYPEKYNLILMDVHMPVMDGLEATRVIRSLDRGNLRVIPIIALTAATEEEEIEKCYEAGMNGFIGKPISNEELVAVIAEHCL